MIKITYRVPHPTHAFAFVEVVEEGDPKDGIAPMKIRENYDLLTKAFQDGEGMGAKDFARKVYEYASTGQLEGGAEWYETLSAGQKAFVNELKKVVRENK